ERHRRRPRHGARRRSRRSGLPCRHAGVRWHGPARPRRGAGTCRGDPRRRGPHRRASRGGAGGPRRPGGGGGRAQAEGRPRGRGPRPAPRRRGASRRRGCRSGRLEDVDDDGDPDLGRRRRRRSDRLRALHCRASRAAGRGRLRRRVPAGQDHPRNGEL
ncbi:MAG: hypothetical protein AVDCRST_MAG38-2365, partial [uncultured Solirubrobacteraceae bacterium]